MVPFPNRVGIGQACVLIALLCGIAGTVDALAYLRLGRLFVANLTGNTVLFAYEAADRHWPLAAERLALIIAFFIGVITDRLLRRWIESDHPLLRPEVASLTIECCVLFAFAFLSPHRYLRVFLLVVLAWTMGLQNDAFQRIGPVNLNTTFLTGDIEKLGSAVAGAPDDESSSRRSQKIIAFTTAWVAYGAGAVLGSVSSHFFGMQTLLIPAAMVVVVLAIELRGRNRSENLLPKGR
ncbi:MAG TPA: YoaK family protein [Alloacidobacterium sp.]|nr:YoaK family protein [Alloacidobacterium sp.]